MNPPLLGSRSRCHRADSVLVLSLEHGFVEQNCETCIQSRLLPVGDLPDLLCPQCNASLVKMTNERKNYEYVCANDGYFVELAQLVLDPHGFGVDSDFTEPVTAGPKSQPWSQARTDAFVQKLRDAPRQ